VHKIYDQYDKLRTGNHRVFTVAGGATLSFTPRLYDEAGGMDAELVLGGDTEFGYRAAQAGAVFIPELEARSWHLGMSAMIRKRDEGARFRDPFVANRVPLLRDRRKDAGRQWLVPYIDVIVDARETSYEEVKATVDGVLASSLSDVRVSLLGPWSTLLDERRPLLADPLLDLRLLRWQYGYDGRVRFFEAIPATSAPAPFRFVCPPGWVPTAAGLHRLVKLADEHYYGLISLALPGEEPADLVTARLERTAAFARARLLRTAAADLDAVVAELYGSYWLDGTEWALIPAADVPPPNWPMDWKGEAQRWRNEAERWKAEAAVLKTRLRKKAQAHQTRQNTTARRPTRSIVRRRVGRLVRSLVRSI